MNRIYHTWDKWECFPAGFYENTPPGDMTKDEAEEVYRAMLANEADFADALEHIIIEWKYSCEHYLTNEKMNRIAWLGQAALAYRHRIPCGFRGGYNLLTDDQQQKADAVALRYLNRWLVANGHEELDAESAQSKTVANIY